MVAWAATEPDKMRFLTNISISGRVSLLAVIAFAGFVSLGALAMQQRALDLEQRAAAEQLSMQTQVIDSLTTSLRDSQLWARSFILDRSEQSITRFGETISEAKGDLARLNATGLSGASQYVAELGKDIDEFSGYFGHFVDVRKELGLTEADGLEGAMRTAVHAVEKGLSEVNDSALRISMLMMRRHEKDFMLRQDAAYVKKHADEAENFSNLLKAAVPPGVRRMRLSDQIDVYNAAFAIYAKAVLKAREERLAMDKAYNAIEPVAAQLTALYKADEQRVLVANTRDAERAMMLLVAVGGVIGLALLAGLWLTGRSISRPVRAITGAMRMLAEGNTDVAIPGLGKTNEVGAMADALEHFRQAAIDNRRLEREAEAARLQAEEERGALQARAEAEAEARQRKATEALAVGLERLSHGDLSFRLDEPFAPEFDSLRHSLNEAVERLAGAMGRVGEAGIAIDSGSREISQSASELSRRTETQAASLEETAASVAQIANEVQRSTERSQQAREATRDARTAAEETGALVREAISAMHRIQHSSQKIG